MTNLVCSSPHIAPERGYTVAKHLLKEHFGKVLKVRAPYMEKITG